MNVTLLAVIGGIIVSGLAIYAGYLLLLLRKQTKLRAKHQQLAIKQRNANIYDNVTTLCMAGIQGQCDLSEISIRIYNIMDYVQGEERVDFSQEYPAISELYEIVKDMARGEERQELPKKERMKQNLLRNKAEVRLSEAITEELKVLKGRVKPLNDQISVQMV
ncbi:DUF2489 domain-containing protein [Vibrio marisflavi]|uniref:DUF2489 domain-containing protein n=1 Tax=Vibrio marisflavi CECT 7928 TaxID=634439 RepID=A0ABM9A9B6_9VIBR|nr:DUF2489 domain-containing protein [Vibrio marisflavi]CAH0542043.1 hypothetical protein VMF7928_04044 [Vibrio marisflavi CECT 7928]